MPASHTAFVTGGTGFIGSHLVERLMEVGYDEVRCLIRSDRRWLRGMNIVPIPGTLTDREVLETGCRGADVVYHIAGLTRAPDEETLREINVEATRRLLDVILDLERGPRRTVVTSSLAVIGTGTEGLATESTPMEPVSAYGRSKAAMERMIQNYRTDIPITVVRPPAVYGPRDTDIYTFFKAVNYGLCPVVGDPERPQISLVHARDLTRGIVAAAHAPVAEGETYFVGSERPYGWSDVRDATCRALDRSAITLRIPRRMVSWLGSTAEFAGRITGFYPPFNREKARELTDACKMCTVEKACTDFSYRERLSLQEGVADTIRWYRQNDWL